MQELMQSEAKRTRIGMQGIGKRYGLQIWPWRADRAIVNDSEAKFRNH